jgi:hypothetical protein
MRRKTMSKAKWVLLGLLAMTSATCGEAPFLAAPGSTMTLIANPPFIVANGGVSVISALLIEPNGTAAPNGTVVQFFTDLGRIEAQGKTVDGVARVNLVADARSGTATVRATSGAVEQQTVEIVIGSANPTLLIVTADPTRIWRGVHSQITANVFDVNGNPIANVPVVFSLSGGTGKERLESAGAQVFTDTNGRAFDTLSTTATGDDTVTVTATAPNDTVGTVDVGVNQAPGA